MGGSALNFERMANESAPSIGYVEELPIPLMAWQLNAGTVIPAVGDNIVGWATTATNLRVIQFEDSADASDIIRWCGCLPAQFKCQSPNAGPGEHKDPTLSLFVKARLKDNTGSATANANLTLDLQMYWHNDAGTAVEDLDAVVSAAVGVTDYADGAEEGFVWYEFDIGAALTAAQKAALKNNAAVQITLGPNEEVGGNLLLEILATKLRYVRHASIAPSGENYRSARV